MVEENVLITSRSGKKFDGLVRKPQGDGPFPAVIFVSGLGMTMHEWNGSFDEIAVRLNDIGILTLQFEFDISKPDGSVRELPLDERAEQFTDAFHWLLARPDVDIKCIGIVAQSFGVPTILNSDMFPAASIVCIGGAYYPEKNIRRVYEELGVMINFDGDTTMPPSSGERTTVDREFWQNLTSFDPITRVKRITQPVLMVHGDQDTKVFIAEAQRIFSLIPSKKKKLKIFNDGDHGIIDVPRTMREEFLKDVVQWFKETLIL